MAIYNNDQDPNVTAWEGQEERDNEFNTLMNLIPPPSTDTVIQHTPGTWVTGKFNNFEYMDIEANGNRICSIYTGIETEEGEEGKANAERIVKCVNSHDALIDALREVSQFLSDIKELDVPSTFNGSTDIAGRVRNAIQNAE